MARRFVVQKHAAARLHYDFRIEYNRVLKSWAVPKQPPRRAGIKRLAIVMPDHEISYIDFEGTIAQGEYGAGTVEIWDSGTYENITMEKGKKVSLSKALKNGKVELFLYGKKLKGGYVLVRMQYEKKDRSEWLFFKMKKVNVEKKKLSKGRKK